MKDIDEFLPTIAGELNVQPLPFKIDLEYASQGNGNALEPSVTITYDITAFNTVPQGATMVYRNVSVTADDIDSKFICVILQELYTIMIDVTLFFCSPDL